MVILSKKPSFNSADISAVVEAFIAGGGGYGHLNMHFLFLSLLGNLLPLVVCLFILLHCMHGAINCRYVLCIINETEYYKRLSIKGLQVSFYPNVYNVLLLDFDE